ncbi:MAG: acyl-CoA dehydrogenase [bacterium]|nr:acyl-CoA dehydrogenase [bacterium]
MALAISEEHQSLAETVAAFLADREALAASRALLEAPEEASPAWQSEVAELGWSGVHVSEDHGGSGYGLAELAVIVEAFGAAVAPGSFVPTAIAAAFIDSGGDAAMQAAHLPGLVDGTAAAAIALDHEGLRLADGHLSGTASPALGAESATLLVAAVGEDVAIVEIDEFTPRSTPKNIDPTRRCIALELEEAPAAVVAGGRRRLVDLARTILAAEAVGVARACTGYAAAYAREREQFGRPIAMFQAVKHHCANMLVATELATAALWDASRAADEGDREQFAYAAAVAAALAGPAADLCANLNIQVHGGIGYTWEHDAHLYLRRALALGGLIDSPAASRDVAEMFDRGIRREIAIELPPEAEAMRGEIAEFARRTVELDAEELRRALVDTGYVMPHWPSPWGRGASPVEQLVIEEEFAAAGLSRPEFGITGWVLLTLIQHATADQLERWVRPVLDGEFIFCQLFSEPDAGSDAAAVKTRGTRVDGGWLVTGQKVWTSGAHEARLGFATVRTDPEAPKHAGVTMMVIDMEATGVEVRPLRQITGSSDFNEVFFDEVFVPDDDVVGDVDSGWTVARATLGNESVSIGGGGADLLDPAVAMLKMHADHPDRLVGGASRIGRYVATVGALQMLNLRSTVRAVEGADRGPEGAVTKLVLSELGHDAAAIFSELAGSEAVFADKATAVRLYHRGFSIAGGTSEIKRNQIGERILGLPRDPLLK